MADIKIAGVLLDLGGVVFVGDRPVPGADAALAQLRAAGMPLRFLTNTTRRSVRRLVADLAAIGIDVAPGEILSPAQLARRRLVEDKLTPHLLVHENLEEEFAGLAGSRDAREAVIVGDAGDRFTYASLNAAYRKLEAGAGFLALAENRSFRDSDGALSLDAGPFVRALEYASARRAEVLGKPSRAFYRLAVDALGTVPAETVMVGDDAEADIGGALEAGLMGTLVRTGKYREGAEDAMDPAPTHIADNLTVAVAWILDHRSA